jgi:hypothetical protein
MSKTFSREVKPEVTMTNAGDGTWTALVVMVTKDPRLELARWEKAGFRLKEPQGIEDFRSWLDERLGQFRDELKAIEGKTFPFVH